VNTYGCENDARRALCDAGRALGALRLNHGKAGNLSLRWHRGGADGLLVTPSALPYEQTGIDDIVWIAIDDEPACPRIDGLRRPSSEWRFHRDLYADRAGIGAIVHTHASYCTTLACLPAVQRDGIPAFHYMIAAAGGSDIRCAPYATFGTQQLSDHAIAALAGRRACLLANHGMIATGPTLASALELAVEIEALARMYWQALQLGAPAILPDDEIARVLERFADYRPDR
jgi:L-fuculose-phosphate aldolase